MRRVKARILAGVFILVCAAFASQASAHEPTVGLLLHDDGAFDGYTLFGPLRYRMAYLIDNDGKVVHSWQVGDGSLAGGSSGYLLEDGSLMSLVKPSPGWIQRLSWDGDPIWEYHAPQGVVPHHDIEVLPNGNVLILDLTHKTRDEVIAAGRDPATVPDIGLRPDRVIEVRPTGPTSGEVVWEWNLWDHLVQDYDAAKDNFGVISDHPELVDLNHLDPGQPVPDADWTHTNSIDYNPELDQIMITALHFSEFWIIDHSTTTEEAAGHGGGDSGKGGDILYRWGNPQVYGAGDETDQVLFRPHDAHWIEPGLPGEDNVMIFNNGRFRTPMEFSEVNEMVPAVNGEGQYDLAPGEAYGPDAPFWTYRAPNPTDFFSAFISGAERLPNGNTLICSGAHGEFFEVTPTGELVWDYISPVTNEGPLTQGEEVALFQGRDANIVFRSPRYGADFPGLEGRDLTPGNPVELVIDTDSDGLLDDEELKDYGTDPLLADTDGDGFDDLTEIDSGFDPTDPLSSPLGDVNGGGSVDSIDASIILQFEAGLITNVPEPALADVNTDGSVTSVDATLILQFTAGLLPRFNA